MPLSGLDIYKLLPKTNCKDCGYPTCLAFAMKLATKGAELAQCPHVSEQSKQALDSASRPPIHLVSIGTGPKKIQVGNETVLYRHDKTFVHQPGLLLRVRDSQPLAEVTSLVDRVAAYSVERVGDVLRLDGFAVECASGDASTFAGLVSAISGHSDWPLILMSEQAGPLEAALRVAADRRPLIYAANGGNVDALVALAKQYKCPLAATAGDLAALAGLVEQITKAGVEDIVLEPQGSTLRDSLAKLTQLRRLALRKGFRLLGYPVISFPGAGATSPLAEAQAAAQGIAKYAGLIVLDSFDPSVLYPLLTLRQNIYTDPQKPIQVKPDLYAFGEANEQSPVLVTTNFSLTYFSVAGEIDSNGIAAWLVITDSEGLSVLTAWAAGKFDAERIAKAMKTFGVAEKVTHRKLIIPGGVSSILGEVEDELPGWQVIVGPREAVDIPSFLKTWGNWGPGIAMILVGERIHVMSPRVKAAFDSRDAQTIQQLALRQVEAGADFIDLNIGLSKKSAGDLLPWLVDTVQEVTSVPLSLDTANPEAMEAGLRRCQAKALLNSVSALPERRATMLPLAAKYGTYLVALTLNDQGVPADANARAEVALGLLEAIEAAGTPVEDVFLDPLLLPVFADQRACEVAVETIRYFKQLADPAPKSIVGLSNVSHGSPNEIRSLLNQTYLVLLLGAGLDAAIADPCDRPLRETIRIVEQRDDGTPLGKLLLAIYDASAAMTDLDPAVVDMEDPEQAAIYKTVRVLTNKTLYAHSYLKA